MRAAVQQLKLGANRGTILNNYHRQISRSLTYQALSKRGNPITNTQSSNHTTYSPSVSTKRLFTSQQSLNQSNMVSSLHEGLTYFVYTDLFFARPPRLLTGPTSLASSSDKSARSATGSLESPVLSFPLRRAGITSTSAMPVHGHTAP